VSESTKALVGTIVGFAALVAIFAIMADCSKAVSRTGTDAVEACIKRGGEWIGDNSGDVTRIDTCVEPKAHQ
jgi:hypothetical protein